MNMQEFYDTYNLNKYNFASIAGVGTKSLIKFANDIPIRAETKGRIEKAMRICMENNLVRPKYDYGMALHDGMWYKHRYYREVDKYEENFRILLEKD